MTTRVSLLSTVFDERELGGLAEAINPGAVPNKATEREVNALFLSAGLNLTDDELKQMADYYSSPVGIKDRELAQAMSARFTSGNEAERTALRNPGEATNAKLKQLVSTYRISDLFGKVNKQPPISEAEIENMLAAIYSEMSETELDEMIAFYSSPVGKKCADASHTAGAALISHSRSR